MMPNILNKERNLDPFFIISFAILSLRPADIHTSGGLASPRSSPYSEDTFVPAGPAQGEMKQKFYTHGSLNHPSCARRSSPNCGFSLSYPSDHLCLLILDHSRTPVTRRERQRNNERQRAQSTSTLAASVGLPCPFSPPGTQDRGSADWKANERLSQANLDAIMFPEIPQTSRNDSDGSDGAAVRTGGNKETLLTDRQTRHSLSDGSLSEESPKEACREQAFSLEMSGRRSANVSPVTATHGQAWSSGTAMGGSVSKLQVYHQISARYSKSKC